MTAVAVVTPSSGSNSAATPVVEAVGLPWVVGADTCPSLFVAAGRRDRRALSPLVATLRQVPGRPVFDRSSREPCSLFWSLPNGNRACPGATTEDRPAGGLRRGSSASCGGRRTREGTVRWTIPSSYLPAQAEPLDEGAVAADVGLGQVVQQAATTADQQEQAPAAVVVVLVLLEVLGQVADPAGQHRDLDLRRAGVVLDRRVLGHDLLLDSALERHGRPPGQVACGPRSGSRGQRAHTSGTRRRHSGYQRRSGPPPEPVRRAGTRRALLGCAARRRPSPRPAPRHRGRPPCRAAGRRTRPRRGRRTGRPPSPAGKPRPCAGCPGRSGWCRPRSPPGTSPR